ncbi:coproporphyrinogen dehydrogenase HemZ [Guggenheimella bovis]
MTKLLIDDERMNLRIKMVFEAFYTDLVLTDDDPDFICNMTRLIHRDKLILFTKDEELKELFLYLETLSRAKSEWGTLSGVRPLKQIHKRLDEGFSDEEIKRVLVEEILVSEKKTDFLLEIAHHQRPIYLKDQEKLSLYVSVPFCPSICSYCNFHTRPVTKKLSKRYLDELISDIDYVKECADRFGREVDILYIGGGTPTSLEKEYLKELLDVLEAHFPRESLVEYTIEAGRIDSFHDKFDLLERASRVCVNPQTLTEKVQLAVHRELKGDLEQIIRHFEEKGIVVNSDLIAGLPEETYESYMDSLKRLIAMNPSNITVHDLSKKRGSKLVDEELLEKDVTRMLDEGRVLLKEHGYHPYYIYRQKNILAHGENVGYEKGNTPCIYNIRMMEDRHEILSVGSAATSKFIVGDILYRVQSVKEPTLWLEQRERRRQQILAIFERNLKASN